MIHDLGFPITPSFFGFALEDTNRDISYIIITSYLRNLRLQYFLPKNLLI